MAFSSGGGGGPMADINVTPLVDVMLVLLIIFMVTAPTLSYPIDIDLPQKSLNPPPQVKEPPPPIACASTPSARCTGTKRRSRSRRLKT
jgi:biopolymer transport protein ExbD